MDLQLNVKSSNKNNKKLLKKPQQKQKTGNQNDDKVIHFVKNPVLGGKTIAKKKKEKIDSKISTGNTTPFSFLKGNNDSMKTRNILNTGSIKSKEDIKKLSINDEENDLQLNCVFGKNKTKKPLKNKQVEESSKKFNNDNIYSEIVEHMRRKMLDESHGKPTPKATTDLRKENKPTANVTGSPQKEQIPFKPNKNSSQEENRTITTRAVSALFRHNPEIPKIGQRFVKPINEKLFSAKNFANLNIHPHHVANLEKKLGLKELTVIQEKAVPVILHGRDVLVRSQTGSGKTLAYALPIVEALQAIRPKLKRQDGIKALVIVPTRELALQTYELFIKLVYPFTWIVPGYLIGGEKRKAEKNRIRKGFNILIGTPGRVCDHLKNTNSLKLNKTRCLVLDEADRLLDMGYEKDVASIVQTLESHKAAAAYDPLALVRKSAKTSHIRFDKSDSNKNQHSSDEEEKNNTEDTKYNHELTNVLLSDKRQSILLSATLTTAVEKLAGLTMENPIFINSSDEKGVLVTDSITKVDDKNIKKSQEVSSDMKLLSQNNSEDDEQSAEAYNIDSDLEVNEKKKTPVHRGIKAFAGIKIKNEDKTTPKNKSATQVEKKPELSDKEENSDDEFNADYCIQTDSFQTAVRAAIEQDEMVIPSTVNQMYIVIPMKLRLVTLSALIIQRCVTPGSGKMLVFMATQDMIDYHCEILSRILTGKKPKTIALSEQSNKKKSKDTKKKNKKQQDEIDVKETEEIDPSNKEKKAEEENDDYVYEYDGIPLEQYEEKMRAEKAFVDVEFFQLHGSMDHSVRMEVFKTFRNAKSGVLLSTDVAARGLDLPHVDCIVQYTGPVSITDYVHRVGRTARAGEVGTAVMFLLPSEVLFVRQLEEKRIRLHQEDMEDILTSLNREEPKLRGRKSKFETQTAATSLQQMFEELVSADKDLFTKACKAFTSWMRFYSTYPKEARAVFDRKALHTGQAAQALALRSTPRQIGKSAPKDKHDHPVNRLSNQTEEQRAAYKKTKVKANDEEKIPSGFDIRPRTAKTAKRERELIVSEFQSGLEPPKKKKKK